MIARRTVRLVFGLSIPLVATGLVSTQLLAGDAKKAKQPLTLKNVSEPAEIDSDEPVAKQYSRQRAVQYLDQAALHWQKRRKCGTCHTNFAYLMARPFTADVSPPSQEVRSFFENMVEERWKTKGPRWPAEVVMAGKTLALNDRKMSGKLHKTTRSALDRMATLQREDGGWDWLVCGWPPMESDDHYGVTAAAIAVGAAPDKYAESETGKKLLNGIRRYLEKNAPASLHHQAMLVWASTWVDDLLTKDARDKSLKKLLDLQNKDGGWNIAKLVDHPELKRKDSEPQDLTSSDGYGTGFIVFVARRAGIPATDPRIVRGIDWLKANQRTSGRWFTRSPTKNSEHFISNAGTAFAVMALSECRTDEARVRTKPPASD